MRDFVSCFCGGRREHNIGTGEIDDCDTCGDTLEMAHKRQLLQDINLHVAPYLRSLSDSEANIVIQMFQRGEVIIGADSLCVHICPIVGVNLNVNTTPNNLLHLSGQWTLERDPIVQDCNPWLTDEMAAEVLTTKEKDA